ncbi:MAG: serine hydrolase, partial [Nocardioides sp.]|nr:serine hydrolase [Nocardioides sp.]
MGEQARWLVDLLRPGASGPSDDAARRHFSEDFLAEVPTGELETLFGQVRSTAPFTLTSVAPVTTEDGLRTTRVRLSGEEALIMQVAVDDKGRIAGLYFRPDPAAAPVPEYGSFEEMSEDLDALGTAQVYVGEVTDGGCTMTYESPSGAGAAPSGSVFKLVVLSAVADAIVAGDIAWNDELVITEQVKSLPSGRLQNRPAGSRISVREAAGLMISISDNTAADLLLATVGDDRIRTTIHDLGFEGDSLRPLLSTRQFFLLGWGAPDLARRWSDANPNERERLLARLPEDLSMVDPADVTTPVWPQGVGWFFTGAEICKV